MNVSRILFVDDQRALLDLEVGQAVRNQFEILTAGSAQEASALIVAHEPQIIVIDRDLPDADGFGVIGKLREDHPSLRILLATPDTAPEERQTAQRHGADDIIHKPITPEGLTEKVHTVLNRARRKHPRIRTEIEVDYASGDEEFLEKSVNLSLGGMFIQTSRPLDVGSPLLLKFRIPDLQHPLEIRGRVMWHQKEDDEDQEGILPGMGVAFENLSEEDATVLRSYLVQKLNELGVLSEPSSDEDERHE